jgi:hypothetical protein
LCPQKAHLSFWLRYLLWPPIHTLFKIGGKYTAWVTNDRLLWRMPGGCTAVETIPKAGHPGVVVSTLILESNDRMNLEDNEGVWRRNPIAREPYAIDDYRVGIVFCTLHLLFSRRVWCLPM